MRGSSSGWSKKTSVEIETKCTSPKFHENHQLFGEAVLAPVPTVPVVEGWLRKNSGTSTCCLLHMGDFAYDFDSDGGNVGRSRTR